MRKMAKYMTYLMRVQPPSALTLLLTARTACATVRDKLDSCGHRTAGQGSERMKLLCIGDSLTFWLRRAAVAAVDGAGGAAQRLADHQRGLER